jgi:hydrogenase maturation protein HypF
MQNRGRIPALDQLDKIQIINELIKPRLMTRNSIGKRILIKGIVQGVGFRPTVYNYALASNLTGWVRNTSSGVEIQVTGSPESVSDFLIKLQSNPPPLAKIDSFFVEEIPQLQDDDFNILLSEPEEGDFLPVSADLNICPDCVRELFDPADRRFRYPFINCTNCGPRFTIIQDIPYDRAKTTMSAFQMCAACVKEYHDPQNRRFHAQPIACPDCGPQVWFEIKGKRVSRGNEAILQAREFIQSGKIVAIKGIGGYLLACDAANEYAVSNLRLKKNRIQKPFALMASTIGIIEGHCHVSEEELIILSSPSSPIVLLEKKPSSTISSNVAPGQKTLGFMLPYTPLHHLLLEPANGFPQILVMTSGNLIEEPIAYKDDGARQHLDTLADGFLMHDREINIRTDDSVVRLFRGNIYPIRRSRGYAPTPIFLPNPITPMLAVGAEQKNTITVCRDEYAFLSQYIGDLENLETTDSFEETIRHMEKLFRIQPQIIACDLHPDYRSSVYAENRSCSDQIPLIKVQHHHAHLAACLADNGWDSSEPVIGVCFDGTGYGSDGAIWGGEFLLGNYKGVERLFHLAYTPLPGGDAAISKPARSALAHLWKANIEWDQVFKSSQSFTESELSILTNQLKMGINSPLTSSMGRLFDAISSILGICQFSTYEGQAAIELEAVADPIEKGFYTLSYSGDQIDTSTMWIELIEDFHDKKTTSVISAKFHNSIARMVLTTCTSIRKSTGCAIVALSGGVWQNMRLLASTIDYLTDAGFKVMIHGQVPTNDGGISLGQIMIASAQSGKG